MAITLESFKFKNIKKRGKQKLFVIPFLFTFANAVFGLLSVIKTLEGDFISAAHCIILAALMDFFDGKLARAFGSTSFLGMELDSLCDAISFCFAPAILLYGWKFSEIGKFGTALVVIYLCFGLLRLARFNIISLNKEQSIAYFTGLPTTLAAFLIATLVISFEIISTRIFTLFQSPVSLFLLVVVISCLMISPIKFLSLKRINSKLMAFSIIFGLILYMPCYFIGLPVIFLGVFSYIVSSVLYYFVSKLFDAFGI